MILLPRGKMAGFTATVISYGDESFALSAAIEVERYLLAYYDREGMSRSPLPCSGTRVPALGTWSRRSQPCRGVNHRARSEEDEVEVCDAGKGWKG